MTEWHIVGVGLSTEFADDENNIKYEIHPASSIQCQAEIYMNTELSLWLYRLFKRLQWVYRPGYSPTYFKVCRLVYTLKSNKSLKVYTKVIWLIPINPDINLMLNFLGSNPSQALDRNNLC